MKTIKIILGFVFVLGLASCTKDFEELNTNPNVVTSDEASGRYFLTNPEVRLYGPDRYPYWRAQLIHSDRFAGHFTFGSHGSWWSDELGYTYSSSYTDAAWGWLAGYFGGLDNFLKLTEPEGEFENPLMYATGQIIKGLYFQMYTDVFGEIPYSQVGDPAITLPEYDTQKDIYKGIIAELNAAMTAIGDNPTTGDGVDDMAENDLYFNGDLQKWKKMANTLKLRIAIRAKGASGDDFSDQAITEALTLGMFIEAGEDCTLPKDGEISQWGSAAYGDVWWNFGGYGSKWKVGQVMINYMLRNNDPRLSKYAVPSVGGQFTFTRPDQESNEDGYTYFEKRTRFLAHAINEAIDLQGGDTTNTFQYYVDSVTFDVPPDTYYIGQPTRLNGKIKSMVRFEFFSSPADYVIQRKNQGQPIAPELVMTAGEAYFLRAQAALDGHGGDAQSLYNDGIRSAMKLWGVGDADIEAFFASGSPLTVVSAENVAIQRWMNDYTDGFEAWAVVRKTGFPTELSQGVNDINIFGYGDINGDYPTRMKYGNAAYNQNGANLGDAIARQGPDEMNTKLWFAK